MTLGERIQELRRREGLSQEALGEALNVSRQAISKWESDITIPEVDKLIALSRLFSVPVGVLLGVEETAPPGEGPTELTDRELSAVEAIVSRYVEETEKRRTPPPPPRRRLWPWVLAGSGLVLVLLLVLQYVLGTVRHMETSISSIQAQVSGIQFNVSSQISGVTGRVEDALEGRDSPIAAAYWTCTGTDLAAGTALLTVSATPKQSVEGMTATFVVEDAIQTLATVEAVLDDASMTFRAADWEVPLVDYMVLWVQLGDSADNQTYLLDTITGLRASNALTLEAKWENDRLSLQITAAAADLFATQAELRVLRGGRVEETIPIDLTGPGSGPASTDMEAWTDVGSSSLYVTTIDGGWPQGAALAVYVKDSRGQEYTVPVARTNQ